MLKQTNLISLLFTLSMVICGEANTATSFQLGTSVRDFQIRVHNVNNIEMSISNFGKFGQTMNIWYGCWWPKNSGHHYIFGGGTWFGTIDSETGDTLVTIGYGPHGGESEYVPGDKDMSISDPLAVIFIMPDNWPPPSEGWITAQPPQKNKSHQDSWCVYNDLDESRHVPGDTRPIGLVVYQTVYAWNLSATDDIIFFQFELKNVSSKKLSNCYFGVCADNAIGNEVGSAANDICAGVVGRWYVIDGESLWVDDVGYQWQEEPEAGWSEFPGALAYDYLQSPYDLEENEDKDEDGILDQYERDSAYFWNNVNPSQWDVDFDGTPDWRDPSEIPQFGMTAFKRFTLNLEPNKDNERYITMQGYNFKTMVYEPYDTAPAPPDDQRILLCSGPLSLEPDSTAIVVIGIMFAYWHDIYQRPDTAIVKIDNTCQFIYDMNWLLPGPPPPPTLTCIPGDARVTLVWDNSPEYTADPYYDVVSTPGTPLYDPYYRQYDFEGYGVWKSLSGKTGEWELLGRYDLFNGIVFEDTTQPESIRVYARDVGLVHSYVDEDVRNGFTYYYAVTSYDYNQVKDEDSLGPYGRPIWFESGVSGVSVVPRRDPANYVEGSYSVSLVSGNSGVEGFVDAVINNPLAMEDSPIYVDFGSIVYDTATGNPCYSVYLCDEGYNLVDSLAVVLAGGDSMFYEFPVYQGLSVRVVLMRDDISGTIFDSVERVSGTYPESLLTLKDVGPNWSYRGDDYEVHWCKKDPSGPVNTVVVIDAVLGDTIPFKPYSDDSLADGWCFRASWPASNNLDTLVYDDPDPIPRGTKELYICGGYINLDAGDDLEVGEPRPSDGEVWLVHAKSEYLPAPANARVEITSVPAQLRQDTTYGLRVKVVPNPYIIHNEWQQSSLQRRLRFINLPSDCTIRIFNLNGELVKTIRHRASSGGDVVNDLGGDEWWDLLSENRQLVASGVYIFHIQSDVGEQVGKFVVVR